MDTGRRSARPWVALAARAGYAAKGVVYALVGVLALQAAWYGSQTRGARGVLAEVAARPFGTALVAGIVVGLSCHAVWRFLQSVLDVDGLGRGLGALAVRAAIGVSGLVYASLALWGTRFLVGSAHAADDGAEAKEELTAQALALPFGPLFVGSAGAALMAFGALHCVRGLSARFLRHYERDMGPRARAVAAVLGAFGVTARALVFAVMGGYAVFAAVSYDPRQTKGLREALDVLARQPHGAWILGVVATGFVAYGAHCFLAARYREVYGQKSTLKPSERL